MTEEVRGPSPARRWRSERCRGWVSMYIFTGKAEEIQLLNGFQDVPRPRRRYYTTCAMMKTLTIRYKNGNIRSFGSLNFPLKKILNDPSSRPWKQYESSDSLITHDQLWFRKWFPSSSSHQAMAGGTHSDAAHDWVRRWDQHRNRNWRVWLGTTF